MARGSVAKLTLKLYRGEHFVAEGTQRLTGAYGAAVVDITGWSIVATVKAHAVDTVALLEVDADLVTPGSGRYDVSMDASDTAALDAGTYAIDIWRTDLGAETVLARGTLEVLEPVRTPA